MVCILSTFLVAILSIQLHGCRGSDDLRSDPERSLQSVTFQWTEPLWWKVYRRRYRKRLQKCIFLKGVIPTQGSTCTPIQSTRFMCLFGEQQCDKVITVNSTTDPTLRCDCSDAGDNHWTWNCYSWDPCLSTTADTFPSPTPGPTRGPTLRPTNMLTSGPTLRPTNKPTRGPTLRPTYVPSPGPTKAPTTIQPSSNLTIGAYYYPWYGADFHKGAPFLRESLNPPQLPKLGRYNDTDPKVIAQHLAWSRKANIGLWVTSWWGPRSTPDNTTLTKILPFTGLGSHKIALFYETPGRIKEPDYSTAKVSPDIAYICQNYFSHPNYYKIDNRPVLFMYVTRKLSALGMLDDVINIMRQTAAQYGFDPYIIGDQVFQYAPQGEYTPFDLLDAVTNYDVRGGMNLPWGTNYVTQTGVNNYYAEQLKWKIAANKRGCAYVPPAVPGYNDRTGRLEIGKAALSRRLTPTDGPGSLFRATLKGARVLADRMTNYLVMVNSFNEWHEDSQIEPVTPGNSTNAPFNLTQGVAYDGYGDLFLDILKEETSIGWGTSLK